MSTQAAPPPGESSPSAAAVLTARLRQLVARLHELDPQVRDGAEESVHDMRVAVRRLRSTLTSFAPAFDAHESLALRTELRWIGAELGGVRDPEVQCERLLKLGLGSTNAYAGLVAAHDVARRRLAAAMDEPRYSELLGRLSLLAQDPSFTESADLPADELVRDRARKAWRRVRADVGALPPPDATTYTEDLHEVRKSAKRLQYLLETGRTVAGEDGRRLRRAVRRFQRRLGDHHDAALSSAILGAAGESGAEAQEEAAAVTEELPVLWRRVSTRARRWLS